MNILIVSHGLYPCKIGGAEIFNYYLIRALTEFHKIFVITSCKEEINSDAAIIRIKPRKFILRSISIPIQDFLNISKLHNKIDLVHLSYMSANWMWWLPYPLTKILHKIPYIITIHGGGMHKWKPRFPHKLLFKNASAVIGVSERIKREYEKRTGREIKLIPPLIPFRKCEEEKGKLRIRYDLDRTDTILLCLGSIKRIKGNDILLEAFIKLGKKYIKEHKLKLIFAGDGDLRKNLEEKTNREDYSEYVRFLGNIPHEDVPKIYKIADIYIIPSIFEGNPISLLEALYNEMPIIGSDTSGINDIIANNENGLLFGINDPTDLKKKIMYLINNQYIMKKMANKAKETFDYNYNFEAVVKKYTELYQEAGRF